MSLFDRKSRRGSSSPEGDADATSPDTVSTDALSSEAADDRAQMAHGALPRTVPEPELEPDGGPRPPGYRASKRTSRTGKQARRQAKAERVKEQVTEGTERAMSATMRVLRAIGAGILIVALVIGTLWLTAEGINRFVRWNTKRLAEQGGSAALVEDSKDNLLVIGADGDRAIGFLAMKADREGKRVLGVAIPDGAFVQVPGLGFARIGDSFAAGPDVAKDAVSNYLYVPFRRYVTVDSDTYQRLLKDQAVKGLLDKAVATDLRSAEKADLSRFFASVKPGEVWVVPLPVKPVAVGDQRYYEPQRKEIEDLLLRWWNVKVDQQKQAVRVMVFNGVGTPGIGGKAAQQLIRGGFRVVESQNADSFDYKKTRILLYHGTQADAKRVKSILGVGEVSTQPVDQDLADIIVIIGADYVAPTSDGG